MQTEQTTATRQCLWPGCDAFPFETDQDLVEHYLTHVPAEDRPTYNRPATSAPAVDPDLPECRWTRDYADRWVVRGPASVILPGATVTVTKASGETAQVTLGTTVTPDAPRRWDRGVPMAIAAPAPRERKGEAPAPAVAADGTPEFHWTKVGDDWAVKGPLAAMVEGDLVTVVNRAGKAKEVCLSVVHPAEAAKWDTVPMGWAYTQAKRNAVIGVPVETVRDDVPDGYYAYPSTGSNDLAFVRVSREGNRLVVKLVVGGHVDRPMPNSHIAGMLDRIVAFGITTAAETFARELERCYRCGRTLTDEISRQRGIGPECINHL